MMQSLKGGTYFISSTRHTRERAHLREKKNLRSRWKRNAETRDAREEIDRAPRKDARTRAKPPKKKEKAAKERKRERRERALRYARREGTKRERTFSNLHHPLSSRGACLCLSAFEEEDVRSYVCVCDKCMIERRGEIIFHFLFVVVVVVVLVLVIIVTYI